MPLQRVTVTLPVNTGIDERSDQKQVEPTAKSADLNNVDLSERGAIKKRRPYVSEDSGYVWPIGDGLVMEAAYNNVVARGGESSAESHLGKQCQLSRKTLTADGTQRHNHSYSCVGYDGSIYVVASVYRGSSNGYTWGVTRYTADGEEIASWSVASIGSSTHGKCLAWESGGSHGVWLFWMDSTTTYGQAYNADGSSVASAVTINSQSAGETWDVSQSPDDFASGMLVCEVTSPSNGHRTYSLDLTDSATPHTLIQTRTLANVSSLSAQVADDGDLMVAAWSTSAGIELYNATDNAAVTVTATPTSNVTEFSMGRHTSDDVLIAYTWDDGTNDPACYLHRCTTVPAVSASETVYGAVNAARPVMLEPGGGLSDEIYVLLQRYASDASGTDEQRRYILCRMGGVSGVATQVYPVAAFAVDESYVPFAVNHPPQLLRIDDYTIAYPGARLVTQTYFTGSLRVVEGVTLWTFDFRIRTNYSTCQAAGLTIVAGACPSFHDGRGVGTLGLLSPPVIYSTANDTGGGLDDSNDYQYIAVYEFRDARGNVWRSAPSNTVTVTLGVGEDEVDLEVWVPPTRIIAGDEYEVMVALYRNTVSEPTIFYRATDPFDSSDSGTYAGSWNDSGSFVSINDTYSDAQIDENEILYTVSGLQPNAAAPPLRCVVEHRNRVWGIHAETGDVWASKLLIPGEGVHFALTHIVSNPVDDVANALVSTESALLVIYEQRIGQIFGDGPDDLGQGGSWSQIEFLPGDKFGSYSPHTAIATPHGVVMVDREAGPCLQPYGGYPQRIGEDLAYDTWDEDVVVSVDYLQDRDEVRFVERDGNYLAWFPSQGGAWARGYTPALDGTALIDLTAVWGDRHAMGREGGSVIYVEDAAGATDYSGERTTDAPPMLWESAWIKLGALPGIQGRFRLWDMYLLGEYVGIHSLNVRVAYDYDETDFWETTLNSARTASLNDYQIRVRPDRQLVQAIKIYAYETLVGSSTAAFKLSQIRLECGVSATGKKPWIKAGGHA